MSAVVLRCPNCGTTQGATGECDACHEADVRYFCANHTPGRWLDGPACDACGARFGVETAPPPAPEPRARPRGRPTAPLPPASAPRPADVGRAPPGRVRRPRDLVVERVPEPPSEFDVGGDFGAAGGSSPWPPGVRLPRGFPAGFPGRLPRGFPGRRRSAGLEDVLPGAVRAGASSLVGCLVRLVLLAVLALALLTAAFFGLAGGSPVRSWVVDFGRQVGLVESGVPAATERGIAAYRGGDRAGAERQLADAARTYPRSALALLYLARLRLEAGDDYRAREYLAEAARREPESALVRRTLGEFGCALAARGRTADAAEVLAQAGAGPWAECAAADRPIADPPTPVVP